MFSGSDLALTSAIRAAYECVLGKLYIYRQRHAKLGINAPSDFFLSATPASWLTWSASRDIKMKVLDRLWLVHTSWDQYVHLHVVIDLVFFFSNSNDKKLLTLDLVVVGRGNR